MSSASKAESEQYQDNGKGTNWLHRNAVELDVTDYTDTESAGRAQDVIDEADVEQIIPDDVYEVEFPSGDTHYTLFVTHEDRTRSACACTCEGFQHHGYCAHIFHLAYLDLRDDILRQDRKKVEELTATGDVDAEIVDHSPDEPDQDDETVDDQDDQDDVEDEQDQEPATPTPVDPDPTDQPPESGGSNTTPPTPSDPFAEELADDVPERYVMELRGEAYIRRAGYAALARTEDLRLSVDAVEPASSTDWEYARYEATVCDEHGDTLATDVGTSRLQTEDLDGAEGELDELAATRAARRALEWATGAGTTLK